LRVNYRNTQEIHDFATEFAKKVLERKDAGDDGIPLLAPVSAGRHGNRPVVVKLPTLQEEVAFVSAKLVEAHAQGTPWKDMAVLYRNWQPVGSALTCAFKVSKIPYSWKDSICFNGSNNRVKLLPFHSSKGLEFPFVAIPGGDTIMDGENSDEQELRLLYVAMTRATEQLVVTVRDGG